MQLPLMDRYGLYFASSQLICVGQFTDRTSSCTSALEATLDLNIDLQNIKNKKNVSLLMWKINKFVLKIKLRNCFENICFWKQDTSLVRKKLLPFSAVLKFLFGDLSTCFYWFQFLFSWSRFLKNRDNVSFCSLKGTTSNKKIE